MRTLFKGLLAATALLPVPALAQDDRDAGISRRGEMRQIQERIRAERAERGDAPPPAAPRPDARGPDRGRVEARADAGFGGPRGEARPDRGGFNRGDRPDRPGARPDGAGQPRGDDRYFRAARDAGRDARPDRRPDDRGRDWRDDRRDGVRGGGRDWRPDRNDGDRGWRDPRAGAGWANRQGWNGRGDWDGRRDWNDGRRFDDRQAYGGSWNRGWRSDRRYDWNDWRLRNRQAYRLPRYYAPGGWNGGYRRFSVGIRLSDVLFAQNYWIGDPGYYRLPPVWGPYRWVRYYNDALLVDLRYGTVVDTVYDIFW